jgi:hypothetical protein
LNKGGWNSFKTPHHMQRHFQKTSMMPLKDANGQATHYQ